MNKKINTLIFILCATLFNIFITVVCFIILILLYINFLMPVISEANRSWGFSILFLASIIISFLVYRFLIKYLTVKFDFEKYFDSIFVKKYKK